MFETGSTSRTEKDPRIGSLQKQCVHCSRRGSKSNTRSLHSFRFPFFLPGRIYALQPCSSMDSGSNDMNCCISRLNSSSVTADDGPVDPPQVPNQSPAGAMANMSEIPTSLAVLLFAGFTASENASVSRCMQRRHCQTRR